jgi:hypothetical protein
MQTLKIDRQKVSSLISEMQMQDSNDLEDDVSQK